MSLKDKIAAQRKQLADQKAQYLRSYRFKPGKTVLRILPGATNPEDFAVEYGAHYIKDPRDSSKMLAVVGDAEICYGKPDPVREAIGEFISRASERGDEAAARAAKSWLARRNFVVNAYIIGGPDTENNGKVVPIEFSSNQYDSVLSLIETMIEADMDPFDLNNGLVMVVERTGTTVNDTEYKFQSFPNPAKYPADASVLEQRHDLVAYRDSKFGVSVQKALTVMSNLLGKDVTSTAIGAAVAASAALAPPVNPQPASPAPATTTPATTTPATTTPATSSLEDDLLAMDTANASDNPFVEDAVVEEVQAAPAQPATASSASPGYDAILAELDGM